MQRVFDELANWANGVITSASSDQLPPGASPRGRNTMLRNIGEQTALMGRRRGALTLNSTPVTGSAGILGGFQFKRKSGTKYTLLVSDTGRLDQLNSDNTLSVINATAFTSGIHYPNFAVANDLCFIFNDVDQKKFDGTNFGRVGIVRPVAPTAAAAAGGAMAVGVWDVGLTYFNSATGHESSLSDFTTVTLTPGNQQINVSWLAPADAQVTHVRVYVRQQTAGATAYRAVAGATPAADATYGGYAPATLATVLNISAVQYGAFILIAPSTTENEPPATGLQYPCWHGSRLFLADSGNVYYSNVKNNTPYPEAFNPFNVQPVNPNDGDTIVGLVSYAPSVGTQAYGIPSEAALFVFKKFSIYKIVGTDPASWRVSLVTKDFGASSMRSIISAGGVLFWWAGHQGPAAFDGNGQPISLGKKFISATIAADTLNHQGFASVVGGVDEDNQTVIWAVPEFGSTRNTRLIPFNYELKRFAADVWNPFDVYSLWTMETTDHLTTLYLGGYKGQVFQWWGATNDGVPTSTTFGGTVTSSTGTTLTDSTATFATTGGGLVERYVYAISSDRSTIQRRRITSNTATALTVTPAWDTNPNTTYTYVVGAIDFQLDTPWQTDATAFLKKRFEFILVEASSTDIGVTLDVDLFVSMDDTAPKRSKTLALSNTGGLYDASGSLYDTTTYAGSTITYGRLRAATVGKAWKLRVRNCTADKDVLIYKLGMVAVKMGLND